jgi:hypothetical protein
MSNNHLIPVHSERKLVVTGKGREEYEWQEHE